jgi:hypothetical protein
MVSQIEKASSSMAQIQDDDDDSQTSSSSSSSSSGTRSGMPTLKDRMKSLMLSSQGKKDAANSLYGDSDVKTKASKGKKIIVRKRVFIPSANVRVPPRDWTECRLALVCRVFSSISHFFFGLV